MCLNILDDIASTSFRNDLGLRWVYFTLQKGHKPQKTFLANVLSNKNCLDEFGIPSQAHPWRCCDTDFPLSYPN